MKLKVLGTQSPYNTEGHNCPGFFIQDGNNRILLDLWIWMKNDKISDKIKIICQIWHNKWHIKWHIKIK